MKPHLFRHAILACALLAASVQAQTSGRPPNTKLPADLAQAAKDYDAAQLHGDKAELERLLASDYTLVNSRARVETRAELIRESTAKDFKLEPFIVTDAVERVWDGGAVLAGLCTLEGTDAGKAFKATLRFADIWRKRDGRWQVVFTEVTRVP